MVCFWRCSQNPSFQQWIKQIIQLIINILLYYYSVGNLFIWSMSCSYGRIQLQIVSSIHRYGLRGQILICNVYQISCKGVNLFMGHPVYIRLYIPTMLVIIIYIRLYIHTMLVMISYIRLYIPIMLLIISYIMLFFPAILLIVSGSISLLCRG